MRKNAVRTRSMSDAVREIAALLGVGSSEQNQDPINLSAGSVATVVGTPGISATSSINIAAVLDSIAKNPQDRVYKEEVIHLDGYTFTNCCFSNCTLYTENGLFALRSCLIMRDCRLVFGLAALKVIKAFNLMYGNPNVQLPEFHADMDPNASVTIE